MTYTSADQSVQDGRPIELYRFQGDDDNWYFTNAHVATYFSTTLATHYPVAISRSQPRVNQDEPGSSIKITLSLKDANANALVAQWVASAPEVTKINVFIWRKHIDDGGSIPFWIGYVVSARYIDNGLNVELLAKSLDNMFTLQGPRRNWGTTCNHRLFSPDCSLSETVYTKTGTVTAVDSTGLIYTIDAVPTPVNTWVGGNLTKPGGGLESRMIIAHSGNDLTLQYPIPSIGVGDWVEFIEGCNHSITQCKVFPNAANASGTNMENFGGTPYTPTKNPFARRLDLPFT